MEAKAVKILDLKHRWASCSPGGTLNFHWKCMMAPPRSWTTSWSTSWRTFAIPNHTAAFWNEVDKVMPDYRERKEWLRVNGAGMEV